MLTTIKGYYEEGKIFLKEEPHVKTKTDVIVTFLPDDVSEGENKKRVLGILNGKISIADDFNEPLDEMKDYM